MKTTTLKAGLLILCCLISTLFASAQPREVKWLHSINGADSRALTNFNKAVSNSEVFFLVGVPLGMGIYDLLVRDADHFDKTLGITASVVASYAVSLTLKAVVKRQRPFEKYPGYIIPRVSESGYSFPSNHTSGAFALATALTLNYRKWYVAAPAYLWASAVGYSRMQLGVHYPSDVLAGAFVGALSAWGCYQAQKAWSSYRKSRPKNYRVALSTY